MWEKEVPGMRTMAITDNMTPLAKKLVEKGMTKKELAELSGVPLVTIDQWTRRVRKNPNVYQLYKVAQVLECHIEDLIEPEADAKQPE
jgi:transcriptional regulator with XRE-family HTH domain